MKSFFIYVLFAATLAVAMCNKYTIENPKIVYYNPKYMKDPVYTVTKNADDDAYTITLEGENLVNFDDKVSVVVALSRKVGDHYEPTGLSLKFKLCQFFQEPLGKLLVQQLPSLKCPFPAQKHTFTMKSLPLNQLPFMNKLDSSWNNGIRLETRLDADNKEIIISSTTDIKII